MKRAIEILQVVVVVVVMLVLVGFGGECDNTRKINARVSRIEGNMLTFTDYAGDDWEYEMDRHTKDLCKGDDVVLKLCMNGTPHTWYDDVIIKVSKR